MSARNVIQIRRGYSLDATTVIPSGDGGDAWSPISSYQWNCNVYLAEGELGYEIDTGRFKIGKRDSNGDLISWCDLDYAGGGGGAGGIAAGSGIGIYLHPSGVDTLYSVLTNTDNNLTITENQLSTLIAGTTGTYYEIGLASNLSGITDITLTGALSAASGDFSGGVNIDGALDVGGAVTFTNSSFSAVNISATSGNFTSALTVGGTDVSLEGHGHNYDEITNLCSGVAECVNTAMYGSSGVQFTYDTGNNILYAALSGEALAQHQINTTGFVNRTGSETYVTRSIAQGSNIVVTNGDGSGGNPTVALNTTVTGLTSVAATTFTGNLTGNADTSTQVKTITSTSSSEHYITFVDSDNGSATAETVYTDSTLKYIPSTDTLIVSNISGVTIEGTSDQADTVKTTQTSNNASYYITFVDSNNAPGDYESVYTGDGLSYNPSTSGLTVGNNLVVGGNLTVNGTTVTANVDSMVVEDPVIILGQPSGAISDDTKDRGIQIVFSESSVASSGFFGWDRSTNEFIAARDVDIINDTVTNITYLDARFKDIDGTTITASSSFSGPGTNLTGSALSLTAGYAIDLGIGGGAGDLVYQDGADSTTVLSLGVSGTYLISNGSLPTWATPSYDDLSDTPTIGSGVLTLGVSGSGLSGSATFNANQTGGSTFTVTSNATPANTADAIVIRDASGNFSAGTITAELNGNAATVTNGVYTNTTQTITGAKTFATSDVTLSGVSLLINDGSANNSSSNYLLDIKYQGTLDGFKVSNDNSLLVQVGDSVGGNDDITIQTADDLTISAGGTLTLGTIDSATWNGTAIGTTYGGTNITSYTTGDMLYASNTNVLSKLAAGSSGNVLLAGTTPSWGKVNLTSHVTGTLPNGNGGTGFSTYTQGDILYASATDTLSKLTAVSAGNALISNGIGASPSWGKISLNGTSHITGTLQVGNGGTGATTLTGVIIGTGATAMVARAATAAYQILRRNDGDTDYEWTNIIDGGTP